MYNKKLLCDIHIFINLVLVGRVCIDKVDYCHEFSKTMCFEERYIAWAQMNCPDYCGFCQSMEIVVLILFAIFHLHNVKALWIRNSTQVEWSFVWSGNLTKPWHCEDDSFHTWQYINKHNSVSAFLYLVHTPSPITIKQTTLTQRITTPSPTTPSTTTTQPPTTTTQPPTATAKTTAPSTEGYYFNFLMNKPFYIKMKLFTQFIIII